MIETSLKNLYLDLLVETINGSIHGHQTFYRPVQPDTAVKRGLVRLVSAIGLTATRSESVSESAYTIGEGWPTSRLNVSDSMVGRERLNNLRSAVQTVIDENIDGHLIETGVWRGGSCILMRGVLAANADTSRYVFVADSFEGLPPADDSDDAASLHDDSTLAVCIDDVRAAFTRYGLLDDQVKFVKGWFRDTLPTLNTIKWAVVRLDGDMFESTRDGIENLYPNLSPGGFLIVDDYQRYESCRRAIDEFREHHAIEEPLISIDNDAVYWRKRA